MAILHLFRGHPGSAKSTSAKKMFPGTLLLENDQFLISNGKYQWSKERVKTTINMCVDMVKMALDNNCDVVVANTFTKKRYVAAYEKIARERGAKFEVYRCNGDFKNVHGLSPEMVESFKRAMEDWPGEILVKPI